MHLLINFLNLTVLWPPLAPNRRPSLVAVSPAVSGRRVSSGGITPNVATPAVDNNAENRRGSLRDLPNERDAFGAALRQYDRDLKSGKLSHCAYPPVRAQLLNTALSDLPQSIPTDKQLILFDGATDPVQAFDELIGSGLEAVPVTLSQHHIHQADGVILVTSSHPQFAALYKQVKDNDTTSAPASSNSTPDSSPAFKPLSSPKGLSSSFSFSSSSSSSSSSPFTTTPSKHSLNEQCILFDPTTHNYSIIATSGLPQSYQTSIFPAFSSTQSTPPSEQHSRSLRDTLNLPHTNSSASPLPSTTSACPVDCQFRHAVGWFDIRDLASCIVYVYQQPINEDLLEFREGGHVEAPLVLNTRGLDGITDLPTLTGSASFSSALSAEGVSPAASAPSSEPVLASTPINTSTLHPSFPEESPQHSADYMGVVYENDEAKSQGLQIKEQNATVLKYQSSSHRLSLPPMAEEDDDFVMSKSEDFPLTPRSELPVAPEQASTLPLSSSTPTASISGSRSEVQSRSRSQSRHRRKLVTADELSAELTAGDQEAWMATIKQGLGKFSAVGNISTSYLSRRHPVRSVKPNSSLYDVCKLLSMPNSHRVAVTDAATGKIVDIISHRSIIRWMYANKDSFFALHQSQMDDSATITDGDETSDLDTLTHFPSAKSLLDKHVDDLNIGTRNLTQVRDDILGLDVLQEMDEHNRTGLAVVDNCGRLIGATSTRVIKRITRNRNHKTISQPLLHFIEEPDVELNADEIEDENCMVSHGAVVLLDDNVTLGQILSAMFKHNTNRVFLVTEESYPTKVISFSDILQLILY